MMGSQRYCQMQFHLRCCLLQVLCETSSASNQLSQEEVRAHEQHPPKEEVEVDESTGEQRCRKSPCSDVQSWRRKSRNFDTDLQ